MAAIGVREAYTSTGNPLCDRLKQKFADRGAAAVRKHMPATSLMVKRVQAGFDPYENAPNPLLEKRVESQAEMQRRQMTARPAKNAVVRNAVATKTVAKNPTASRAKPAPAVKKTSVAAPGAAAARPVSQTEVARRRSAVAAARTARAAAPMKEVRLSRAPFPFAAVMMLTIFTIMIMVIVYSFAQNYELTGQIDALEKQQAALAEEERALMLQLEERDDIRLIQDIAVNQIGMVKNDLVENRYVAISGGNRVVLVGEEAPVEENPGIFSTMLSAIAENFSKIWNPVD